MGAVVTGYYSQRLAAERLRQCYELAPPRVRQYLEAETAHVVSRLKPTDAVLELGCGYGRVMVELAPHAQTVVGIDTSASSIELGREILRGSSNCALHEMDATELAFDDETFDVVVCVQNGVSAFGVDQRALIGESLRVTRAGGRVLFSSYAEKFWEHRLAWFRLQAEHGLVGPIDWDATRDGVIVCHDGFRATTVRPAEFRALAASLGVVAQITEVDESSVFCEIIA